jgi:hypothetical protein
MQSLNISSETFSQTSNCVVSFKIPTIDELDVAILDRQSQSFLSDRIHQYLTEDPDNLLKNICLDNNLSANFQAIFLAKLSGKSWTDIAREFNVELEKLSDFFQDGCCYCANLFEHQL